MLGQPFAQAVSVRAIGNLQIRDDQIEVFLFQQGTGFTSISCRPYTMIATSQNGSDGFQHGIIVIH